jgi:hypothetical protein
MLRRTKMALPHRFTFLLARHRAPKPGRPLDGKTVAIPGIKHVRLA